MQDAIIGGKRSRWLGSLSFTENIKNATIHKTTLTKSTWGLAGWLFHKRACKEKSTQSLVEKEKKPG